MNRKSHLTLLFLNNAALRREEAVQLVDAILRLIRALVATVLIGAVALMAYLVVSLRLELVKPQFFILGFAVLMLLCSLWLRAQGYRNAGSVFAGAAMFTMAAITLQAAWPGVFRLVTTSKASLDRSAAAAAMPRRVPCQEPFFITDAEPRYWVSLDDDPLVCYDRPGPHPVSGRPLVGITPGIAKLTLTRTQPQLPPPTVAPVAQPVAVAHVTDIGKAPNPIASPTPSALTIITRSDGTARIVPAR
jgi:hypothetical protein